MNKMSISWKGYIPAITLPFDEQQRIDWNAYKKLLNWLVDEGMHGIVINGTTGEWFSLTDEEVREVFAFVGKTIDNRIPVIAGCTGYTAKQASRFAQWAKEADLDGVLIAPPPYMVPNDEELFQHYQQISQSVSLPICVYNWPRGTQVDISPALMKRLATIEHVVAVKNSTTDMANFIQMLLEVGQDVRYFGAPMNALGISLLKHHQADGLMGAGAVLGRIHPQFFEYLWAGEEEKALECGKKDQLLFKQFFNPDFSVKFGSQQAILKTALNLQGLPGGHVRQPLIDLTPDEEEKVKSVLNEALK
ncbi:dihydrodipicolinate synthase family protein [Metaplanococcus flavidus]|uniref:Dihydrodipicolinate synthase family protein n=1 Tax=Metaplanococcus flavidus TaxID=569883 RepID=A0ABW3LF15_9BACL